MAMTFYDFSPNVHVLFRNYINDPPPAVQQDSGTRCILQADCPGPSQDQLDWLRMFSCHRTHRWDISLLQYHTGNSTVKLCVLLEWWKSCPLYAHSPYSVFLCVLLHWAGQSPAVPLLLPDVSHRSWPCNRVFWCYQTVWVEEGGLYWTRWKLVYCGELM